MSTISVLPSQIAGWLSEQTSLGGIRFITEYPAVKKEIPLKRVTVAVGIGEMEIVDSFTENDEGVLIKNEYCRLATIKIKLAIHVPYSRGGAACHDILTAIIDCLTFDTDLNVVESGCSGVKADRDTDAFVLDAYILMQADFCPADTTGMNFHCFLDKTLLCGSHVRDTVKHVTAEDKALWNAPVKIGSYTGTGAKSRSVKVGFKPTAVFVFCRSMPAAIADFSSSSTNCYVAAATQGGGMAGVGITSDGFSISSASAVNGGKSQLNDLGMTYSYIALKI